MEFHNLNSILEAEKILQILYRVDLYIFVSVGFIFSTNFSIILIFGCVKPTFMIFVLKMLFSGDHSLTFFLVGHKASLHFCRIRDGGGAKPAFPPPPPHQ